VIAGGTEHSHWGLWSTWRSGPDLVRHIAEVAAECTLRPAEIRVRYRDDEETAADGEDLQTEITGAALKHFRELLIEAGDEGLKARITFIGGPQDVLVGDREPVPARVRAGVVLEVMSSDPARGDDVRRTKRALAAAIERGRPRGITRRSRHGWARREAAPPGRPDQPGASASRALERAIVGWPPRSGFPVLFVGAALLLYTASVAVLARPGVVETGKRLDLDKSLWPVLVAGAVVAVLAFVAQRFMFAPVEVRSVPNALRAAKWVGSGVTLSTVLTALAKYAPVEDYFS